MIHIPVLQKEVLEYLDPKPNENFVDCTIGGGGHTFAILEKILPNGRILGIDWSSELIDELKVKTNLILVCDNFVNLKEIVSREKFYPVSGILFDLGMSSWHLEESGRGFSFLRDEPLDMRFNVQNPLTPLEVNGAWQKHKENKPLTGLTAEKIINYFSELEISQILKEYGEEQFSQRIAKEIVSSRKLNPIKTTKRLVEIIRESTPSWYHRKRTHFATKTFQALRVAVNDEIGNLEKVLPAALESLKPGGRLVVISFHSLEDRVVKNFFREKSGEKLLKIITKKPTKPSQVEIKINPRSRSAKLRAAQKHDKNINS